MSSIPPDELEKRLHATLRALPARRAPVSLEARVFAAIAAREALPWYHRAYGYWPKPVRVAFLIVTAAIAAVVIAGGFELMTNIRGTSAAEPLQASLGVLGQLRAMAEATTHVARSYLGQIPSVWLYGGLAAMGAMYASLIGLGAAAYRTLWQGR